MAAECSMRRSGWVPLLRRSILFLGVLSAGLGSGYTTLAQDFGDNGFDGIEEIMVTARRRQESLQETPISITALSAASLERRNLTNLMEVGAYTPNVTMAFGPGGSGGGSNAQIYIRGIGQTDFLFTTDPGVGIYVDGVFHPRTLGGVMDLLDLERVEILRGPQGTLFGKNTIGGAVSLISSKPDVAGEKGGFIEVTTGRYSRLDVRAGLDLPLVEDRLAAKVSLSTKNRDGYATRVDFNTGAETDEQGDEGTSAGRVALRWLPSDETIVDFNLDITRERENAIPTALVQFEEFGGLAPLWNALVGSPGGTPMSTAFVSSDPFTTFATGPNLNELDVWGASVTIEHELSNSVLKSITAYREMDALFGRDGDGSPLQYVHTNQNQEQEQFSQEIQLTGTSFNDSLAWVVGAFYFDEHGIDTNDVRLASGLYSALEGLPAAVIPLAPGVMCPAPLPAPCAGGPGNPINIGFDIDFDIFNEIDIRSYAFFGQGTYNFTDKLSGTLGLRYTFEEKDYTLFHFRVNSGVPTVPMTTVADDWSSATPMGSLSYQWTDDVMGYMSVSRGFKSGGFNGRPILVAEVEPFEPEFVTTYEIGVKSELLGRRLRLNASAFYNDYSDIQVSSVTADATGNLVLLIDNAAEAEVKGIEVELLAVPSEQWEITASLGLIDAEYTDIGNATDVTLTTEFVKTPEVTASAGISYQIPVGEAGRFTIRGDWAYTDKVFQDIQNTESIAQDAFSLLNARVVYENLNGNWEVAAFGTNLGDETFIVNGLQALNSFGTAEAVFGPPRQWGLSFKKRF